jgi:hypothetical protein
MKLGGTEMRTIVNRNINDENVVPLCAAYKNIIVRTALLEINENNPKQGAIGTCWILAAIRAMQTKTPWVLQRVVSRLSDTVFVITLYDFDVYVNTTFPHVRRLDRWEPLGCACLTKDGRLTVSSLIELAFMYSSDFCPDGFLRKRVNRCKFDVSPRVSHHYADIHGGSVEYAIRAMYQGAISLVGSCPPPQIFPNIFFSFIIIKRNGAPHIVHRESDYNSKLVCIFDSWEGRQTSMGYSDYIQNIQACFVRLDGKLKFDCIIPKKYCVLTRRVLNDSRLFEIYGCV